MRAKLAGVVLLAGAVAPGCGDDSVEPAERTLPANTYDGTLQQRTFEDRSGDVRITADADKPPAAQSLDLQELSLRRQGRRLRVTFVMAAEPRSPMQQQLAVIERKGVLDATIEVFHNPGLPLKAFLKPANGTGQPLEVEQRGRSVTVRSPLTGLMDRGRFKFRTTIVTKGEIVDRLPDAASAAGYFPARSR